jgi:ammonia channel protein AmtB
MICTSLFATTTVNEFAVDGAFYGNGLHLGKTLAVLCVLVPWVAVFTWGCLFVTDKIMSLRVTGGLLSKLALQPGCWACSLHRGRVVFGA